MKLRFPKQLPIILKIAAILVGIIAQVLITQYLYVAIFLFVVAIILIVLSVRKETAPEIIFNTIKPGSIERLSKWGYILGVSAIILAALAFLLFTSNFPNIFAWIFHAISIFLAILSITLFTSVKRKKSSVKNYWHWGEITALIAIFLLAIFLRFYKINELPYGFWYDEADYGLNAIKLMGNSMNYPVFAASTRLPAHLIYMIAFFINLFGQTIFSVRIVSAIFGVGTVVAAFLAGSELFNRRVGIILAFCLAVSRWDLVWSRLGMHGVSVPFFELLTVGLLLRAFRNQRYRDYLFAGISMGLGFCFYFSFWLFPLVVLIMWISTGAAHPGFLKGAYRHLLVFILGAVIVSIPVSQYAIFHPEEFLGRVGDVSIFQNRNILAGLQTAIRTTGQHLAMFNYRGDNNGRHNIPSAPMLDPVIGALFILGIAICLYRIKRPSSIIILTWLFLMLLPGIFSLDFESPQSYRSIGSLPAAYLLAVVPLYSLFENWKTYFKRKNILIFLLPLIFLLCLIGGLNFYAYFIIQANTSESWMAHSTPETIIARKMDAFGNQVDYYVSTLFYDSPTIMYLAPTIKDYHRVETYETFPFPLDGQRETVFFLDPDRKPVFDQGKKFYKNAEFIEHKSPDGTVVLYEIDLKTSDIRAIQGLTGEYFSTRDMQSKAFLKRTESNLNFEWTQANTAPLPFYSDFSGVIYAPIYGVVNFELVSPAESDLYLDEKRVLLDGENVKRGSVELAKGVHSIRIFATGAYGKFKLSWQLPGEEMENIPVSVLFLPPVTNNGLLGSYYSNAGWQEPPSFRKVDPFIHFYYHNTPLKRPYTVEWNGRIKIPKSGIYELGLESIDESQLFIDTNMIVNNQNPNQYQGKLIELSEGYHQIRVRFSDRTGYTHVNLYWKPPESSLENIPSEVLFIP